MLFNNVQSMSKLIVPEITFDVIILHQFDTMLWFLLKIGLYRMALWKPELFILTVHSE